jgi:hypothetical protein
MFLSEQQRRQALKHVPLHIVGQHAEQKVATHSIGFAMVDRTDIEFSIEDTKGPFHPLQPLVRGNHLGRAHPLRPHVGSDYIKAVKGLLLSNSFLIPPE